MTHEQRESLRRDEDYERKVTGFRFWVFFKRFFFRFLILCIVIACLYGLIFDTESFLTGFGNFLRGFFNIFKKVGSALYGLISKKS